MTNKTYYSIGRLTDNTQASADVFNAPLNDISDALNDLASKILALGNKSAVIQWQAQVDKTVTSVGDLVYSDEGVFKPALAALNGKPGLQGQSVLKKSCRILGLVLSISSTDNSAVLLRNGYYKDADIILLTLGTGALPGIYYLSASDSGKATTDPTWNMRQPCISYYGNGLFSLFTGYIAHDNHHHASYAVPKWYNASSITDKPTGAGYYAKVTQSQLVGLLTDDTTAVFYLGLLNREDFAFSYDSNSNASIIWYLSTVLAPSDSSVVLFNNYPFAYNDSVVRSIQSTTLACSHRNGTATILMPDYTYVTQQYPVAIAGISGKTAVITPVVASLKAGAGTSISNDGQGTYQINCNYIDNAPTAAQDIQLNGAQRANRDYLTYIVMPSGQSSNFVMSLPVTGTPLSTGSKIYVKPWIMCSGPGTGTLSASLYWIPVKVSGAVVPVPTSENYKKQVTVQAANSDVTTLMYSECSLSTEIAVLSPGILMAVVSASSPTNPIYLYQTGFRYRIDNLSSTTTSSGTVDVMGTLAKVLHYNGVY